MRTHPSDPCILRDCGLDDVFGPKLRDITPTSNQSSRSLMANQDAHIAIVGQERTGELSWTVQVQCGQFEPERTELKLNRCPLPCRYFENLQPSVTDPSFE